MHEPVSGLNINKRFQGNVGQLYYIPYHLFTVKYSQTVIESHQKQILYITMHNNYIGGN